MNTPEIIFQDHHLLVLWKPHGMASEDGPFDDLSLQSFARQLFTPVPKWGPHPVNRLDRPTAGWVVFALKKQAFTLLSENWHSSQNQKVYRALLEGHLPQKTGWLENHLEKNLLEKRAEILVASSGTSKIARLHYTVLQQQNRQSLVQIHLETGRYHQIRAQMAAVGAPICGDAWYGAQTVTAPHKIALCAGKLQIVHPITKAVLMFEKWPQNFEVALGGGG